MIESRPWKILLIDDDPDDFRLTREMLTEGGRFGENRQVEIEWVSSVTAAEPALQGQPAPQGDRFDAALIAGSLSERAGLELIRQAAASRLPFPLILIAGRHIPELEQQARQTGGAACYLTRQEAAAALPAFVCTAIENKKLEASLQAARAELEQARLAAQDPARENPLAGYSWEIEGSHFQSVLGLWGCGLWNIPLDPGQPGSIPEEIYLSPELKALIGFAADELPSRYSAWVERIHPQDAPLVSRQMDDHFYRQSESFQTEYRIRHKDGSWVWVVSNGKIIYSADGIPLRWAGICCDHTSQKQAESEHARLLEQLTSALRVQGRLLAENHRQHDLLERLVNVAPIGICFLEGPEHRFSLTNPAFASYAPNRLPLTGRSVAEVWPELADRSVPVLDQVFQTGLPFRTVDLPLKLPGWSGERFFSLTFSPIPDERGNTTGILALAQETTENVFARQRAEAERDLLQALIQSIQDEVWFCDVEGNLSALNAAAAYGPGAGPDPVQVKPVSELLQQVKIRSTDTAPRPEVETPLLRALLGEQVQGEEFLARPDDPQGRIRQYSASPALSTSGQILGAVVVARDITAQKKAGEAMQAAHSALSEANTSLQAAHAALRKSEARLRRLVDSNIIGVMYLDPEGMIVEANDALLEITGYDRQDLTCGSPCWLTLTPPEFLDLDMAAMNEADLRGACKPYEKEILRKDGSRAPVLVGYALLDETPSVYVGFLLDLTEMQRAKQDLQAYAERLERSNRDLQEFAFVASHDLQEPLRKVEAFTQRLEARAGPHLDDEGREYLVRTRKAAARMRQMILDLLALSRVATQGKPFTRVDLNRVAAETLADLEISVERSGGQVIVDPLPIVTADPFQMRLLLQNLISNALKFHRRGASPVVQISARVIESSGSSPGRVEIYIHDNGIGFDMQSVERIFQPFQRLSGRSRYEGSGMGLPICRRIVERHGGSLTAQSSPGGGSTFTVSLPQMEGSGPPD